MASGDATRPMLAGTLIYTRQLALSIAPAGECDADGYCLAPLSGDSLYYENGAATDYATDPEQGLLDGTERSLRITSEVLDPFGGDATNFDVTFLVCPPAG